MRLVTRAPSRAEGFLLHGSIPYEHGSGHKYQESDQSIDRSRDLGKILDWGKENGTSGGELFWVLPAGYRRHGCCWRIEYPWQQWPSWPERTRWSTAGLGRPRVASRPRRRQRPTVCSSHHFKMRSLPNDCQFEPFKRQYTIFKIPKREGLRYSSFLEIARIPKHM